MVTRTSPRGSQLRVSFHSSLCRRLIKYVAELTYILLGKLTYLRPKNRNELIKSQRQRNGRERVTTWENRRAEKQTRSWYSDVWKARRDGSCIWKLQTQGRRSSEASRYPLFLHSFIFHYCTHTLRPSLFVSHLYLGVDSKDIQSQFLYSGVC